MPDTEIIYYIIKLILGGFIAFLAILAWSRTGDSAWMCMIAGIVITYAGIVYDLLKFLGVVIGEKISYKNLSVTSLLFTIIPSLFFMASFIIMIKRNSESR